MLRRRSQTPSTISMLVDETTGHISSPLALSCWHRFSSRANFRKFRTLQDATRPRFVWGDSTHCSS